VVEPLDTANLRDKWSQWEDAVLDHQSLRCDFLDALDEIDRLREENADLAVIIERLGKPVVNTYRWEDVKRFTAAEAERDRLAALVAEYRAESNETWTTIRARAEAAEAKLAEVEVELSEERDHAEEGWERARHLQGLLQAAERGESKQIRRAETAEARLAENEVAFRKMAEAAEAYSRALYEAKAALARVEALCDEHDHAVVGHCWRAVEKIRAAIRGPQDERHEFRPGPFECAHHTGGMNCGLPPDDPIHRGPQDEEAAEICGANGCSNRATGMRKSYVPGWPDVPDCGMHPQRSGIARPEPAECDAEDDWCFTHDRKHFRCYTAGEGNAKQRRNSVLVGPVRGREGLRERARLRHLLGMPAGCRWPSDSED
jgi:hypothetical protein